MIRLGNTGAIIPNATISNATVIKINTNAALLTARSVPCGPVESKSLSCNQHNNPRFYRLTPDRPSPNLECGGLTPPLRLQQRHQFARTCPASTTPSAKPSPTKQLIPQPRV